MTGGAGAAPDHGAAPTVSAVVPTRDRPELLRGALAAIDAQEYPGRIETIVVYDRCAPDLSLERDDARRPVRVLRNAGTPGLAGARNTGIRAATGELVGFCDDDDEWLPGKLAAQVAALRATGAEFACCGIRVRYDDREHDRVLPLERVPFAALLRDRLTELHPSTFLVRRDALLGHGEPGGSAPDGAEPPGTGPDGIGPDGIGLVDERIPGSYAEDYEFLLRAARRKPLVNVPEPYALVRWHRRSYFTGRWETISAALEWLLARYPEFATSPPGLARLTGQIAFARAAGGDRRAALHWARRTLARNPREPRAYLALAVAGRVVPPDLLLRVLHRRGRGI
ncbi:glycosyltransferase family 2 protein [Micromonospora sp. NPDC049559]|uniref:glycosyltransferase family 2 protein n=1 Tax=Micromonospora sp. NPDC049559 TaxID=3155923 RepID=UPI003447D4D0